jgi:hypothetical protein
VNAGRGDDEAVPDGGLEGQPVSEVEDHPYRIEHTADSDEHERSQAERIRQRGEGDAACPAEDEVGRNRQPVEPAREQQFESGAGESSQPDEARQANGPGAAEAESREGRVGARDHQEDAGLVELAQPLLSRRLRREVVGAGTAQHDEEAERVEGEGGQGAVGASVQREGDEHDGTDAGSNETDGMDDRIGDDLAARARTTGAGGEAPFLWGAVGRSHHSPGRAVRFCLTAQDECGSWQHAGGTRRGATDAATHAGPRQ